MFRIRFASILAVVVTGSIVLVPLSVAGAGTDADLAAARQRVAEAQAEANAVASELSAAEGRYQELESQITQLETGIQDARAQVAKLLDIVRERAVRAYTQQGTSEFELLVGAGDVVDVARRTKFLDAANRKDNAAVRELAALREDLAVQRKELDTQRARQRRVKEELDQKFQAVQASLAAASQARDELAARLQRERDAAAAAELARIRAQQAANGTGAGGGAGQIIANPGGGSFQCPLSGSAYSNNYGPRGSGFHYGIDMFAPTGRPEVAVKAGSVGYATGGAGGNQAYLAADDGNVYFYAHMSQFVGGARRVSQGEVIGLVGSTGNSTAPHLHFEIRIGGANGQRINPYPTLVDAGC